VVKTIGDEIMAVFESAAEAIGAGIEIQQRIDALPPASGAKLSVRVGIQWGPVLEENDDVFGDTVNTASRLAQLAKGGQILTSAETLAVVPPQPPLNVRAIDDLVVRGKTESVRVFEVIWQESGDLTMKSASLAPVPPAVAKLRLRHGDQELILDAGRPAATLGRDGHCDVVIRDPRASRNHGRIERRRDKFVLVDQSTNGTYITPLGEAEAALKREETVLRGRGRISFGHAFGDGTEEILEFEVLS
jgi:adenylate cyclase